MTDSHVAQRSRESALRRVTAIILIIVMVAFAVVQLLAIAFVALVVYPFWAAFALPLTMIPVAVIWRSVVYSLGFSRTAGGRPGVTSLLGLVANAILLVMFVSMGA